MPTWNLLDIAIALIIAIALLVIPSIMELTPADCHNDACCSGICFFVRDNRPDGTDRVCEEYEFTQSLEVRAPVGAGRLTPVSGQKVKKRTATDCAKSCRGVSAKQLASGACAGRKGDWEEEQWNVCRPQN